MKTFYDVLMGRFNEPVGEMREMVMRLRQEWIKLELNY